MKLLPLLCASLLLIVPSARQDSPELKQADDLTESVVKLIDEKSLATHWPLQSELWRLEKSFCLATIHGSAIR